MAEGEGLCKLRQLPGSQKAEEILVGAQRDLHGAPTGSQRDANGTPVAPEEMIQDCYVFKAAYHVTEVLSPADLVSKISQDQQRSA